MPFFQVLSLSHQTFKAILLSHHQKFGRASFLLYLTLVMLELTLK
jgi:hypothetical protein